jgi:hypothetical protein
MLLTAYLDESGTHNASPISVMAGYLGTAAQWRVFDADWVALLQTAGVRHVHAVDLFKRTRQFRGWPAEQLNAFAVQLDGLIARHLELGFSIVVRDDDYRKIYVEGAKPRRSRLDSKYGVCFRACLAFVPSYIVSELKLATKAPGTQEMKINFVLEDGHRNVGDARRLFDLFKADALPEWQHLVGDFEVSKKDSPGAQAADFLAYCVYRTEFLERLRQLRSHPMWRTHLSSPTLTPGNRCRNLALGFFGFRSARRCCGLSRARYSPSTPSVAIHVPRKGFHSPVPSGDNETSAKVRTACGRRPSGL